MAGRFIKHNKGIIIAFLLISANIISWGVVVYIWPKSGVSQATSDSFAFLNMTLAALQSLLAMVAIILTVLALVGFAGYKAIYDSAVEEASKVAREEVGRLGSQAIEAASRAAAEETRLHLTFLGLTGGNPSAEENTPTARPNVRGAGRSHE